MEQVRKYPRKGASLEFLNVLTKHRGVRVKNQCAKTVKRENAYEVWQTPDGTCTWYVLKKWQADDDKPFARWFCDVVTPVCPNGEMGDVYVSEIKGVARKIS